MQHRRDLGTEAAHNLWRHACGNACCRRHETKLYYDGVFCKPLLATTCVAEQADRRHCQKVAGDPAFDPSSGPVTQSAGATEKRYTYDDGPRA